jgi:hypothetical protein
MSSMRRAGSIASPSSSERARMRASALFRCSASDEPGSIPSTMFSATVIGSTSMKCWWTMPIPRAIASCGLSKRRAWPSTTISPESAA